MDRLRSILANVQKQLGQLSVTQKLLIGTLCVLVLMTLFLVSQYAGSPTSVALFPTGTSDDQQRAASFLDRKSIPFRLGADGKVMLTPEHKYIAIAAMTKEQALPTDKKLMFEGLVSQSSWIEDLYTKQTKKGIAQQNELAKVARAMGYDDASVFIATPQDSGGLGAAAKKAVAQVVVFPASGQGLDQPAINALADLVSCSVVGLDPKDVAVVDGRNKRSYRAMTGEDAFFGGGSYIEQVARIEKRVQEKIADQLRFMPDAIVGVNVIVDGAARDRHTTKVLPKGAGSQSMPTEETSTNDTTSSGTKGGAEAGVGANTGMDLNRGGGSDATNTTKENSSVKSSVQFGTEETHEKDARGKPTKINVSVSVPREYVAAIWKQAAAAPSGGAGAGGAGGGAASEPTDKDISDTFEKSVRTQIEGMIKPLVETDGNLAGAASGTATQLVAGTVNTFLIPISMASIGSGASGGARSGFFGGGSGGGISAVLDGGVIKTALLGVLSIVAMGMMLMMVRKAGKAAPLPTAEELVGIPPALEPGTDVVGEAVEGDTAMAGIEVDDQALRTGKMLEEIGALVKSHPQTAASVFNRWLSEEE